MSGWLEPLRPLEKGPLLGAEGVGVGVPTDMSGGGGEGALCHPPQPSAPRESPGAGAGAMLMAALGAPGSIPPAPAHSLYLIS